MSDWTCGRCGTRVLSGLSHACHYSAGGNVAFSEQVAMWTSEKLRADAAEAKVARLERRLAAKTGEADFAWTAHAEASQREQSLRAAIEKLRDDVGASWDPLLRDVVARRLTDILSDGGEQAQSRTEARLLADPGFRARVEEAYRQHARSHVSGE